MRDSKNLLVELLVEELPPKALRRIGTVFQNELSNALNRLNLIDKDVANENEWFASPRRLGAKINGVLSQAPDTSVSVKLMPTSIGLDADGKPTSALLKKLTGLGIDVDSAISVMPLLRHEHDGKTDILYLDSEAKGAGLAEGLHVAIKEALAALPIPKVMTYQLSDGWSTVNFVRPAHGLVALYGADVVPVSVLGLQAGRETHGHRFEASVDPIVLKDVDSYAEQLEKEGAVIASFTARYEEIARQLTAAAAKVGGTHVEDDALLDEVTALVERPNVLIGQFEAVFLEVPQECLILTMKANQKYFPLLDTSGKLTNKFLIVSNINPADPGAVIQGNERVVRPRLADAKFFFDQDRKKALADRIPGLAKVVYHNLLGSQGDRVQRVAAIARSIGQQLGGDGLAREAAQAALLAKADLLTDMVGEFPELQGIMGRYYALHDGLSAEIADAIEDHYKPRFAGDSLPRGLIGVTVALADKLETLAGMFSIGQMPTGDKDPFALRRHALGVIRILIEKNLPLGLDNLLQQAFEIMRSADGAIRPVKTTPTQTVNALVPLILDPKSLASFFDDRLSGNLREQGYSAQEVDAVISQRPQRLGEIPKRLAAVRAFAALPEAAALAAANKRVGNILKKVEGAVPTTIDQNLLNEAAEVALYWTLGEVKQRADIAFDAGDYTASLKALAALKVPVDAFFNDVMVNVEDIKLRNNRLALLANLHEAMNRVADLSKLST